MDGQKKDVSVSQLLEAGHFVRRAAFCGCYFETVQFVRCEMMRRGTSVSLRSAGWFVLEGISKPWPQLQRLQSKTTLPYFADSAYHSFVEWTPCSTGLLVNMASGYGLTGGAFFPGL